VRSQRQGTTKFASLLLSLTMALAPISSTEAANIPPKSRSRAMKIKGDITRALLVAVTDYSKHFDQTVKEPTASDIAKCMARIDSYDFSVSKERDYYSVTILPTRRCVKPGETLKAVATRYIISASDFGIARTEDV
jgi:hypothetical protein